MFYDLIIKDANGKTIYHVIASEAIIIEFIQFFEMKENGEMTIAPTKIVL